MAEFDEIEMLGVRVSLTTVQNLHDTLKDVIDRGDKQYILNVNVHALNIAFRKPDFRQVLNNSRLTFCDGAGVALGARILGHRIPPRITYADWMWQLAEFAAENRFTLFLLGARPGVSDRAAVALRQRVPDLRVVGTHHGYFDARRASPDNCRVVELVNSARPNILIVCFGMPKQEEWLSENWDELNVNVGLTGGAALDYVSGQLRRGPKWMTDHGLEWLARMIIEPRRLWRRYLLGNPVFLWRIFKQRLGLAQNIDRPR